MDTKKIGIVVGREWSWPPAFIEEVNRRDEGVSAEFVKLGGTRMAEPCEYAVIIDRISHEISYYRTYLKNAVLAGTTVINNPFWWSADDKFFGACLAAKIGVAHPKTIALPTHSYADGIVTESLRNLCYPVPWEEHIEYLGGFPVILKPVWGGGFKSVYKLDNFDDLWRAYNETGTECMLLQEFIAWEKYVRCVCIGKSNIMTIKFDINAPWPHRYFREDSYLTDDEGQQVLDGAMKLNQALGYDMNAIEFALKDGVPYAIDFTNPAPDFDVNSLTPHYFDWVVKTMADYTIDIAKNGPKQTDRYSWSQFLDDSAPTNPPASGEVAQPQAAPPQATPAKTSKPSSVDNLTKINGIGPVFEQRLNAAGIYTYADLAQQDPNHLHAVSEAKEWQNVEPAAWIAEAQQFAENPPKSANRKK